MIYQWVYSYSCWNRRKHPEDARIRGFGTYSWTDGLELNEIDELERRCGVYNYPANASIPSRPTAEEINKYLPVAFYSFTLASGKKAIVRTRYVGEGFYDKRWGAIISHGLILERDMDWPSSPMAYFDSPVFWNELPQDIRNEALTYKNQLDSPQPPSLPPLEIDDLKPQATYTLGGVTDRIRSSALFAKRLDALIQAYLTTDTDKEPLYINAPNEETPWLFAGLMMAFPDIPVEFRFSTWLSDKIPSEQETGRWYHVAAVEKHDSSLDLAEPLDETDTAGYAETLFSAREKFVAFLQNFTEIKREDLPKAVKLYRVVKTEKPFKVKDSDQLLRLLLDQGNEAVRKEFMESLDRSKLLAPIGDQLLKLLLEQGTDGARKEFLEILCRFKLLARMDDDNPDNACVTEPNLSDPRILTDEDEQSEDEVPKGKQKGASVLLRIKSLFRI